GLHRLELFNDSLMHYLSEDAFIPAIGQGILTIQTAANRPELTELLRQVNDPISESAAVIERSLLSKYEGGCHLPIGALATRRGNTWRFRAFVGGIKSHRIVQDVVEAEEADSCAGTMFVRLEHLGASALLQELNETHE
ncbi:MAG: hypothetical protein ACRD4B_02130, partial [Acidobacteriota bacterium]